jgi:hypothetical protein
MDARDERLRKRARIARETAEALERVNPRNDPTLEDIARFHELHARHEREFGREERALLAEERARHARAVLTKRSRNAPSPQT